MQQPMLSFFFYSPRHLTLNISGGAERRPLHAIVMWQLNVSGLPIVWQLVCTLGDEGTGLPIA
jgi:hypothetical protein